MRKTTHPTGISKKALWIIIISSFVCIVAIPPIATLLNQAVANHNAATSVQKALDKNSVAQDEIFNNIDDKLASSEATEQKIGNTKVSTCAIESISGGGWVVSGYSQKCFLRYTAGYYANHDKNETRTMLKDVFGSDISTSTVADNELGLCELTDYGAPFIVRYVNVNSPPSVEDVYGYLDYQACGAPSKNQGLGSVDAIFNSQPSFKVLKDIDTETIDVKRSQIWLEYEHIYYDENLGCAPGIPILGCADSPRKNPIQS